MGCECGREDDAYSEAQARQTLPEDNEEFAGPIEGSSNRPAPNIVIDTHKQQPTPRERVTDGIAVAASEETLSDIDAMRCRTNDPTDHGISPACLLHVFLPEVQAHDGA